MFRISVAQSRKFLREAVSEFFNEKITEFSIEYNIMQLIKKFQFHGDSQEYKNRRDCGQQILRFERFRSRCPSERSRSGFGCPQFIGERVRTERKLELPTVTRISMKGARTIKIIPCLANLTRFQLFKQYCGVCIFFVKSLTRL